MSSWLVCSPQPACLPPYSERFYAPGSHTVAHFLDQYSKADTNKSAVAQPDSLGACTILHAPDAYDEENRGHAVEPYLRLQHWTNRKLFAPVLAAVRKQHGVVGCSVSLVYKHTAYVKFQTGLDFREIARPVSLDAHALLSAGAMVVLDARSDWRFCRSPFVVGPPEMRFYCGVPLSNSEGTPVGVLAIFSGAPKSSFPQSKVDQLGKIADALMDVLNTPYEQILQTEKPPPEHYGTADMELMQLALRLGRATSTHSTETIFERDGSGSAYSKNSVFKLHKGAGLAGLVGASVKADTRRALRKADSLKEAARTMVRLVGEHHALDAFCIVEIRFIEQHTMARKYFPDSAAKLYVESAEGFRKTVAPSEKQPKCKIRLLSAFGEDADLAGTDISVWRQAHVSATGLVLHNASGDTFFSCGVVYPFFRSRSVVLRKPNLNQQGEDVDIYLRSGGYLVGAFNRTRPLSSGTVSRLQDHVQVFRHLLASKQ